MLTRYISHHYRFRANCLVLHCLRKFHDSQAPPIPSLDWTPGKSSGSGLEDPETPVTPVSKQGHRPRSETHEVDLNPSLDWYSGERNADFSTSRLDFRSLDVQQPRLGWLTPKGNEESRKKEEQLSLLIRKLESQLGGPRDPKDKSLVRRYVLDIDPEYEPKGQPLVRRLRGEAKVKIGHRIRIKREYLRSDTESSKQKDTLVSQVKAVSNPQNLRTITTEDFQQAFIVGQQGPPVTSKVVNMEGQPYGNVNVNNVEETIKERIVNETIPHDTNLIGEDNKKVFSKDSAPEVEVSTAGTTGTTGTTQKPHDLKRTNLGSYQKAPLNGNKRSKKRKVRVKEIKEGSNEEVLGYDIKDILSSLNIGDSENEPLEIDAEIKITVSKLSSTGEGLAVYNGHVYTVPFGVPGDQVTATVRRHNDDHSVSKILSIDQPSPDRDDSIIGCKYFGTCKGCQFQMLPYAVQLEHKRTVVQRAFKHFSNLSPELLPEIGPTMPSPLQYGYRTKLTPHFNGPRKGGFKADMPVPNIGYFAKDPEYVMDIEDCPIGTDTVREGMTERRKFVKENLVTAFKRGATLLLRESTVRTYLEEAEGHGKKWVDKKLCITDHKARSIEYIGDLKFDSPAGSFFQNNNSILESFTAYIRENLNLPVVKKAEGSAEATETTERPRYLVDAYCGSGLFSITCGEGLEKVWGIDVDRSSIESARENAKANNIQNAFFIDSPAENIFGKLTFPGSETSLIIDPPRKGCDKRFLDQLLDFAPKRVVYVSCNVHTQARDIGYILSDERGKGYRIDSIRGCDFFPQTYHVEGVAVMTKID